METQYYKQKEYAEMKGVPFFAGFEKCPNCRKNFWAKISMEEAETKLITGCPICNHSFCD